MVRFGFIARWLDIDNFLDAFFSVDEMISLYAASETKSLQDSLKVCKEHIPVLGAADDGQKKLLVLTHSSLS